MELTCRLTSNSLPVVELKTIKFHFVKKAVLLNSKTMSSRGRDDPGDPAWASSQCKRDMKILLFSLTACSQACSLATYK